MRRRFEVRFGFGPDSLLRILFPRRPLRWIQKSQLGSTLRLRRTLVLLELRRVLLRAAFLAVGGIKKKDTSSCKE
jgi:hypothetical protein